MMRAPHIAARLAREFPEVAAYRDLYLDQYRIFDRLPNTDGVAMACIPCDEAQTMSDAELRARVLEQWTEGEQP